MSEDLKIVGHIDVPDAVLKHRFYQEAAACARLFNEPGREDAGVIGTSNTTQCELYGWACDIERHVDNSGYVYLLLLNDGESTVNIFGATVPMPRGSVVRLNDYCAHWTTDDVPRVAAFIGSFAEPADDYAMGMLRAGVEALAAGAYYGAPRVATGFRVLMPDECLVAGAVEFDDVQTMLLSDAKAQGRYIIDCAQCGKPAVKLDRHFPYQQELCRCADCMRKERSNVEV